MKAFKNRNIFECWTAMRLERYIGEGAFVRSASLRRLLLVLFLPKQEKDEEVI